MILTTSQSTATDLDKQNYLCKKICLRTNPHALWYLFKYLCVEQKEVEALFFLPHPPKSLYIFIICLKQRKE